MKRHLGQKMKICLKKGKMSNIPYSYNTVDWVLAEIALNINNTEAGRAKECRV